MFGIALLRAGRRRALGMFGIALLRVWDCEDEGLSLVPPPTPHPPPKVVESARRGHGKHAAGVYKGYYKKVL